MFWIEHIMQVLMKTCEHLIVLHHGEKLAEGAPQTVAADRIVAAAYFGKKGQGSLCLNCSRYRESMSAMAMSKSFGVARSTFGEGEVIALFGGNGAGKSTILRAISRLVEATSGRIVFLGRELSRLEAHELPELGLIHVPEGRHVFPQMTVQENLEFGSYAPRLRKGDEGADARLSSTFSPS